MYKEVFLEDSEIIEHQANLLIKEVDSFVLGVPLTNREKNVVKLLRNSHKRPIYVVPWDGSKAIRYELEQSINLATPSIIIFKIGYWGCFDTYFDTKGIQDNPIQKIISNIHKFENKETNVYVHPIRTPWIPPTNYYLKLLEYSDFYNLKISLDLGELISDTINWNYNDINEFSTRLPNIVSLVWLSGVRLEENVAIPCACEPINKKVWNEFFENFKKTIPIIMSDRLAEHSQIIEDLNILKGVLKNENV